MGISILHNRRTGAQGGDIGVASMFVYVCTSCEQVGMEEKSAMENGRQTEDGQTDRGGPGWLGGIKSLVVGEVGVVKSLGI